MNDTKANQIDKTVTGNFFEDFTLGQEIVHATPRTVTVGDVSLFTALYGPRFAVQSSDAFAQRIGYPRSPIDDLLVFHIVIGKTVPDISRNAIANLGYAEFRFIAPVYPGDVLQDERQYFRVSRGAPDPQPVHCIAAHGKDRREHVYPLEDREPHSGLRCWRRNAYPRSERDRSHRDQDTQCHAGSARLAGGVDDYRLQRRHGGHEQRDDPG